MPLKFLFYSFGKVAALFLEFINPLHKSDYIPVKFGLRENEISAGALAIENIGRVFIGYWILHISIYTSFSKIWQTKLKPVVERTIYY